MDPVLKAKLNELEREIDKLKKKRVYQTDIPRDVVKMRHIGEGVRFIQTGLAADRPTTPAEPDSSCMIWFSYDTNVLSVWNTSTNAWKTTTLS